MSNQARLASRRAYNGRLIQVDVDTVQLPSGVVTELEMVRHPGAAAVVPFLSDPSGPDPQILLLKQYRYAALGSLYEIPAGTLKKGETPEDCARRELLEEAGLRAGRLEALTGIYTTPGFTDEYIHLFMATDLNQGTTKHDRDEVIETEVQTMSKALEMIQLGRIVDAKTIVALLFAAGFKLNW
jgi:ADP-ribose pyrophosphatase